MLYERKEQYLQKKTFLQGSISGLCAQLQSCEHRAVTGTSLSFAMGLQLLNTYSLIKKTFGTL